MATYVKMVFAACKNKANNNCSNLLVVGLWVLFWCFLIFLFF